MRAIQDRKAGLADRAAAGDLGDSEDARVKLGEGGFYDTEIYDGSKGKFEGYVTSIAATDEQDVCCAQDYPFHPDSMRLEGIRNFQYTSLSVVALLHENCTVLFAG